MLTEAVPHQRAQAPIVEGALVAGLIAIFAANAIGAVVDPASYHQILEASPLSRIVGLHRHMWLTTMIAVNDAAIAAGLIASSIIHRWRRWMMAAAGGWLGVAAVLKLTACIG